jgi:hypothetical protein
MSDFPVGIATPAPPARKDRDPWPLGHVICDGGRFSDSRMTKWFMTLSPVPLQYQYHCGSFVGGAQIAQGVGYRGIRRTRRFTWFGPSEHNTLRPRVNGVVLLCLSARLRSSSVSLSVCLCLCLCLPGPFIAQGRAVTVRPHGPTGGPGAGRPLRS